jgi:predicted O-methyltransferase YrrM
MGVPQPESTFTRQWPGGPDPSLWTAWDSDSTEVEVGELVAALVRATQPERVVETGTAFGSTTWQLADALRRNGHGFLYSLEPDPHRAGLARGQVESRGLAGFAEVVEESSLAWEPPGRIDLLFSDSVYEIRRREIARLRPWLPRGAMLAVHDTTSAERGHGWDIRADVQAMADEGWLRWVEVRSPRGLALGEIVAP